MEARITRKKRIDGPGNKWPVGLHNNAPRLDTHYKNVYGRRPVSPVVKNYIPDNIKHPNWYQGVSNYQRSYSNNVRSRKVTEERQVRQKVAETIKQNLQQDNVLGANKIRQAQAKAKLQPAKKVTPDEVGPGPQLPLNSRTTYRNHYIPTKNNYRAPRRCTPDLLRANNPNMKKVGQTHNKDTYVAKSIDKVKEDKKRAEIRKFDLKSQALWFDKTRPIPTEYQHKYNAKQK